jgi:hypothetical protein
VIVLWLPVAAGVLIGKLLGGRIANVTAISLRFTWLLLGVAAAQTVLVFAPPVPPGAGLDPLRIVLPVTTAAMGVFVALNRHLPGMWVVLIGVSANLAVIATNGGLMPTNSDAMARAGMDGAIESSARAPGTRIAKSKDVMLSWEETRLPWLSDALVSPTLPLPPAPRRKVFSAGDLFIAAGLATLTAQAVRGRIPSRTILETNTGKEEHGGAPDSTSPGTIRHAGRAGHAGA